MKKRMLFVIVAVMMALVVALAACETDINNGKIDVDPEILDQLPCTVEVTGLEEVTGTAKVALPDKTAEAAALAAVKETYYVAEGATTYAVDVKIEKDGKEVKVGKPVTVSIELKNPALPLDQYEVFHVHDGKAEQVVFRVDGNKIVVTVDNFSIFVVVPAHVHAYGDWTTEAEADCANPKYEQRVCVCGAKETRTVGEALGHADENKDELCDRCGASLHVHAYGAWRVATEPTCTEKGVEVRECACGAKETQDVEALGHDKTHHELVPETCTEDGNVEYFTCARCGKVFLDAECTEEITLESTVVKATGHVDANEDGKCDLCGAAMGETPEVPEAPCAVAAIGANGSVVTADVQALSAADEKAAMDKIAVEYYIDEGATVYAADISVKGATAGNAVRLSVTLKNPALSLDQYVVYHVLQDRVDQIVPTVDGDALVFMVDSFSPFIFGPKHLHTASPVITETPADCTKDGAGYTECVKCKKLLSTVVIPALGHIDENKDEVCDRCGETMHEHVYGEWAVATPASCTENGEMQRECACGATETKVVYALGHIDENKDNYCDRCGADMDVIYTAMIGKVYVFDRVTGDGIAQDAYDDAYAGATVSFFAGKHAEYHTYKNVRGSVAIDYEVVLCGNYTIVDGVITLTTVNRYLDGEQFNGYLPTVTFSYDDAEDEVSIVADDGMGHQFTCYFAYDSEITATQYTPPALADNWDAAKIEAAFKLAGADKDYTLPKLDYVDEMTVSDPVDAVITITCLMASKSSGFTTASTYVKGLASAFYAYKLNDTDGYLTANSECFFTANAQYVGQTPAVIITVRQFAPMYPAAAITAYLEANEITDEIISFMNQWAVAYEFSSGKTTQLVLSLRTDADGAEVAATLRNRLKTEKGYDDLTGPDGTVYLSSANKQIVFKVVSGESPAVEVVFLDESALPILNYPAAAIEAWLMGTTDDFVEVSDELVTEYKLYYEHDDSYRADVLRVVGLLPKAVDGEPIADAFAEDFAAAGYKYTSFFIRLSEEDSPTPVFAWVSANKQIAVLLSGFSAEYLQNNGYGGDFAYYNVTIINLTTIENAKKSFLTSLLVDHQLGQDVYDKGSEFAFRGNIALGYRDANDIGTAYYTFNSQLSWFFSESLDNYFDFDLGAVNMNEGGEYTVGVSFKANADIKGTFTIKVFAMTSITAEYSAVKKDGRPYYIGLAIQYTSEATFKGKYTVTRHFSDGTSNTVAGTECDFSKEDVDVTKGIQNLTISHTYKGVTCTCDVEIGVYMGYNFSDQTSWDVTADGAYFAIYAIGGSYGEGTWTTVNRTERGDFGSDLFVDMTEFYIVRLNPAYDVFGETVYGLDSEGVVWNKSAAIGANQTSGTFTFLG